MWGSPYPWIILSLTLPLDWLKNDVSGVDGLQYEVEHIRVQQCQGYQGPPCQPLETRYLDVQQVHIVHMSTIVCTKLYCVHYCLHQTVFEVILLKLEQFNNSWTNFSVPVKHLTLRTRPMWWWQVKEHVPTFHQVCFKYPHYSRVNLKYIPSRKTN